MPWLPFFADETDAKAIIDWLNDQTDIAFLVPEAPNRWKAVLRLVPVVDDAPNNNGDYYNYLLWHVAGPLVIGDPFGLRQIADPWQGWEGSAASEPYLSGVGYSVPDIDAANLFSLELYTRHRPYTEREYEQRAVIYALLDGPDDFMRLSTLSWHSNLPDDGWQVWERFKSWVETHAIALGDIQEDEGELWRFWAFPSALRKLKAGMKYTANGFPLDSEIEATPLP